MGTLSLPFQRTLHSFAMRLSSTLLLAASATVISAQTTYRTSSKRGMLDRTSPRTTSNSTTFRSVLLNTRSPVTWQLLQAESSKSTKDSEQAHADSAGTITDNNRCSARRHASSSRHRSRSSDIITTSLSRLNTLRNTITGGVWCDRALLSLADALELSALGGDHGGGWGAAVSEEGVEGHADGGEV